MKKFALLLCMVTMLSCTKDVHNIKGVWALVDEKFYDEKGGDFGGRSEIETWTFNADGKGYENGSSPFEYNIDGDFLSLHFVNNDREIIYEIQEMTSTSLQVYLYVPRVNFHPGDYLDGYSAILKFKRIE